MVIHLKWEFIIQYVSANISSISKCILQYRSSSEARFPTYCKPAIHCPFSKVTRAHKAALFLPFLQYRLYNNTSVTNFENKKLNLQLFHIVVTPFFDITLLILFKKECSLANVNGSMTITFNRRTILRQFLTEIHTL